MCLAAFGGRTSVCGVVVRVFAAREKYSNVREDTTGERERGDAKPPLRLKGGFKQ